MQLASNKKSFSQMIAAVGPSPCDTCDKAEHCADLDEACKDFSVYQATGYLMNQDRNPTRRQYMSIYRGADE